jgi:hypothetical protein
MKEINVKDEYRKNELSTIPGGSTVSVYYDDGTIKHYDKVKDPLKYVSKIKKRNVEQIICQHPISEGSTTYKIITLYHV